MKRKSFLFFLQRRKDFTTQPNNGVVKGKVSYSISLFWKEKVLDYYAERGESTKKVPSSDTAESLYNREGFRYSKRLPQRRTSR